MHPNQLLLQVIKTSPLGFLAAIGLGLAGAIFNGIGVTLIIPLVLDFLGQDMLSDTSLPPLLRSLFSGIESIAGPQHSLALVGVFVLVLLLKNLATYGSTIVTSWLSRDYVCALRQDGLQLLLGVDWDYHANAHLGELMNYFNTEVNRVATAVRTLARLATLAITILVFWVILVAISWPLTLVAVLLIGAVGLVDQLAIRRARGLGHDLSAASAALSNRTIEMLRGIRLVKVTASETQEYATIQPLIHQREQADFQSQVVFASIGPMNEMLSVLALLGLVVAGRTLFADQLQTVAPVLLIYLVVLFRLLPLIGQLNSSRSQFASYWASAGPLSRFLNRQDKPFMASGERSFSGLQQGISLKRVSFRYPRANHWALQDISLTLLRGQTLALVGTSGAGKSTLADLLCRFYDPTQGVIELDGVDLRQWELQTYRRRLGVVSQDPVLFNLSVAANIAYGNPQATMAEIMMAARQAHAEEFILQLPQGYDTLIGDRGVLLSGGQRQRLAIARALIRNPDILILDEATSALDTLSEQWVQQAIDALRQNRTTLVIAHRLSTVQTADQIAVLAQGRVVELGPHAELLAQGQHYAQLYASQWATPDVSSHPPTAP
ncbi:ABC transporter ATP-binding protein [Nodosilinea sp. P-1105]|uniref:ABC transporter ATP-binding protein n=1 Tax=Nodosilinea sp. P-1105 TaxID=2546229 RepID=UPI00146E9318|nr:ABC transporter ATP-binding protein [Nodosilinea sp. P-1105]NMF84379.1 ABC transporter ATP-binding protein [Nodosilinea sp. P-1105]